MNNNDLGLYNKYIYGNNSYLSLYVIKKTYKNHKNSDNLYDCIDNALKYDHYKEFYTKKKYNLKENKVSFKENKISFKDMNVTKIDSFTNTSPKSNNEKGINTDTIITFDKSISASKKLFNSNNATISKRIVQ